MIFKNVKKWFKIQSEYRLLLIIEKFINILSYDQLYSFAEIIGSLLYRLIPIRKKIAIKNLKIAFPNITKNEIECLLKKSYINLIKSSLEYFILPYLNENNYEKFGWIENTEIIEKYLEQKRSIILLGAHYDNPEFITNLLQFYGFPMVELVKKQKNKLINKKILDYRTSNGVEIIYKGKSIRHILKALLKRKKILATVGDVSISPRSGILSDFFNVKTPTPVGPAKFALKTNAIIIPVFGIRLKNNQHRVIVSKPIEYQAIEGNENEKIQFIIDTYNKILEDYTKKYPEQWFWFHNRWKKADI
jgi:KDO2-lipid IV(A) lauroyltransferase